ncbi:MAG: HpsJ family protein [Cyanobacteria bacterium J06621_12]
MTKSSPAKLNSLASTEAVSTKNLKLAGVDLTNSIFTLRVIGYGLISLWLLDILSVFHPLKPFDPMWGMQILGQLVERVGVLLIGLGLILTGDVQRRRKWELPLLKIIIRMILVTAIAYFCLIPLGIGNTVRIANLTKNQVTAEAQTEINRLTAYRPEIAASSNVAELQQFVNRFGDRPEGSNANTQSTLKDLKQQANSLLSSKTKEIRVQAELVSKQRNKSLIKRSLKWNIGAILSGFFLLLLWGNNGWILNIKR